LKRDHKQYQILISGVGGQGVLFITRLLAEAAIGKDMSVFTSETHGMAQRGGTVVSHLKVGSFTSPLIIPGEADGLVALKAENVAQHGDYLRPGAWAVVNSAEAIDVQNRFSIHRCDADRLSREIGNPRALNLIVLGFLLACTAGGGAACPELFCSLDDIRSVLDKRLAGKAPLLQASNRALEAGSGGAIELWR
jgi:indolepyruvate ferredoxin oxidoreductase beta subunit